MVKTAFLAIWFLLHPVHVTMTSIDHVKGTDSLKVFVRMYYDDFLLDYAGSGLELLENEDQINDTFPAELMNQYLNEKVNITVNNKHLKGKLLNLILKDNEISIDLIYRSDRNPREITVKNLIMTDLYSDQANMTIIRIDDFEEGVMFTPQKTEETFSLK